MMVPELARTIVREQPVPPRTVPSLRLLAALLGSRTALWLQAFGLIGILVGGAIARSGGRGSIPLGLGIGLFGLFTAAVPTVYWFRLVRALGAGPLAEAHVREVRVDPRSAVTADAMENGFARGVWIVSSPGGRSFEEPFEVDEPFARQIARGSRVRVIVHPVKDKTLFQLGCNNEQTTALPGRREP